MKPFVTLEIAIQLAQECSRMRIETHLRDQLKRASSSIALNLAEGAGRLTPGEQQNFYSIAMGSLRETTTILRITSHHSPQTLALADKLGAHLYRLIHRSA